MKYFLLITATLLSVLAYAFGLRAGYLTETSYWAYNAQGRNNYSTRAVAASDSVTVSGSCDARGGQVTVELYAPSGRRVGAQQCTRGQFSLRLMGTGEEGFYRTSVLLDHFTGNLKIELDKAEALP